jgi:hypothetical protein
MQERGSSIAELLKYSEMRRSPKNRPFPQIADSPGLKIVSLSQSDRYTQTVGDGANPHRLAALGRR